MEDINLEPRPGLELNSGGLYGDVTLEESLGLLLNSEGLNVPLAVELAAL